jgi:hypothetical protein
LLRMAASRQHDNTTTATQALLLLAQTPPQQHQRDPSMEYNRRTFLRRVPAHVRRGGTGSRAIAPNLDWLACDSESFFHALAII